MDFKILLLFFEEMSTKCNYDKNSSAFMILYSRDVMQNGSIAELITWVK